LQFGPFYVILFLNYPVLVKLTYDLFK